MKGDNGKVHLACYNSVLAAVATFQQVNAIADPVLPRQNNEYQMFEERQILGAYAGHAAAVRAKLMSSSLALRTNPQIYPVSGTLLPPTDPNFMEMTANPVRLRANENLRAEVIGNGATDALVAVLLADKDHSFKVEHRDLRWIGGTVAVTTVVNAWALGAALTLDDALEGGEYACYGMAAFFATALAARLIFPNQVNRPGCLGQTPASARGAEIFRGGTGLWGIFDALALPQLEVLDTAAAAVTYRVWLLCSHL